MLMRVLYGLLVVSVAAVLVSVLAMWWRLRRHLRAKPAAKETEEPVATAAGPVELNGHVEERNLR